jgi:hypothetical protein
MRPTPSNAVFLCHYFEPAGLDSKAQSAATFVNTVQTSRKERGNRAQGRNALSSRPHPYSGVSTAERRLAKRMAATPVRPDRGYGG